MVQKLQQEETRQKLSLSRQIRQLEVEQSTMLRQQQEEEKARGSLHEELQLVQAQVPLLLAVLTSLHILAESVKI